MALPKDSDCSEGQVGVCQWSALFMQAYLQVEAQEL